MIHDTEREEIRSSPIGGCRIFVMQQLDSDLRKSRFWVVVRKMRESAENVVRMGEREAQRGRGGR